jgi:pimeloyl-ACP methyl ester carboxylesterase
MYHVWWRKVGKQTYVAIAFRGTSGSGDWIYGNLWWFTRFFLKDNQLTRAEAHATSIFEHFDQLAQENGEPAPRYVTTGHSLGGGLAEHVLYAFPEHVEQAIAFDPSSVTGFVGVPKENRIKACSCNPQTSPEARFIRVYQTYEVLTDLRIFHKIAFKPERHVQELRFPFDAPENPIGRHSMLNLAENLYGASGNHVWDGSNRTWLESRGDSCTAKMIDAQEQSCKIQVNSDSLDLCPQ